jgi:hypothetical protein
MTKMNVLSCQDSEESDCRDRGMSEVRGRVFECVKEMSKDFGCLFLVKWHYVPDD